MARTRAAQQQIWLSPAVANMPEPVRQRQAGLPPPPNSPEFADQLFSIQHQLLDLVNGEGQYFPVLQSGDASRALEAACATFVPAAGTTIAFSSGYFGDHLGQQVRSLGRNVEIVNVGPRPVSEDDVRRALKLHHRPAAVLFVYTESSLGIVSPINRLVDIVQRASPETLIVLDAVPSVGAEPIVLANTGGPTPLGDVVVASASKSIAGAPGLAITYVHDRTWRRRQQNVPTALDVCEDASRQRIGEWRHAAPISQLLALDEALLLISSPEEAWQRHAHSAGYVRERLREIHFQVVGSQNASASVTAARVPPGVSASALISALRQVGVIAGTGRGSREMEDGILRLGTFGWTTDVEIHIAIERIRSLID